MSKSGRLFSEIGLAMFYHLIAGAPARKNGLGAGDAAELENMIDIAIKYFATADTKRPDASQVLDLSFSGRVKLTDQEWVSVEKQASPYAKYFRTQAWWYIGLRVSSYVVKLLKIFCRVRLEVIERL